MDLYHSLLTPDDLNDLIIKYKIPRDLYPLLPYEEFVIFELLDDAIGIYHWMFDFFGVRIPFSSFLLALIKHYRVHISQLGPLGLNKVITFEVLCRSLQIEPTKSGFVSIDRLAISDAMVWRHPDAAIDDPRPDAGSFNMADVRRLSAHVIKLRDMPKDGGLNCLCYIFWLLLLAFIIVFIFTVMGIHDFICLPEWTGAEVQEEPHFDVRPTLQRLPFYCTPPATANAVIPEHAPEDLAVSTPSSKIVVKAKASQKRKASTSGAALSHVAKCTRSALAQSSGRTTRPSLFVGDSDGESDGDDDACVEIPLVTPLHSAAVITPSRNQGRSSAAPTAEGSNTRDSWGKGIMVDDAVASYGGGSRPRPSSRHAPSFRDVFGDAIHTDFFPFSAGPYYATYPKDGVAGNCEFTQEDEMVRVESLSDDQLTAKMSVLHCMMMLHGGELLARYHRLNQSHHKYVLSTDSRLKDYKEKVASLTGLELQVSTLKKQVYGLNDKLATSDASFAKSKAKGKKRKKKIKSFSKSLDKLHYEVARLSAALNQATILKVERDEEILRLKATPLEFSFFFRGQFQGLVQKFLASDEFSRVQGELLSLAASAGFERGLSMHQTKDEFAAVLKKMVNFMPGAQDRLAEASPFVSQTDYAFLNKISKHATEPLSSGLLMLFLPVALEQNGEQVNAMVDGSDLEMADGTARSKSGSVFVQGVSRTLDDVTDLVEVRSGRVPFGPDDVVVALSAYEKGNGLDSSSTAVEEASINPFGVVSHPELTMLRVYIIVTYPTEFDFIMLSALFVAFSFLLLLVSSTDGLVLIPIDTSWLRNSRLWLLTLLTLLLLEAASPANSTSQSMALLDALNFNRMTYEYIFSSGLTRIILMPEPSSIASLPRHSIRSSPSFGMANVGPFAVSILVGASRMGCFSSASFRMNLLMAVSCKNTLRI
ncbi:hypothetical protein Tco_1156355 [Tanacetum coccineum]